MVNSYPSVVLIFNNNRHQQTNPFVVPARCGLREVRLYVDADVYRADARCRDRTEISDLESIDLGSI